MIKKVEEIDFKREIKKEELLVVLKKEASTISIMDIMTAHAYLVDEGKYVQGNYREEYLKAYSKGFILRVKEIRDNKSKFKGTLDKNEFKEALELLNEQEKMFIKLRIK